VRRKYWSRGLLYPAKTWKNSWRFIKRLFSDSKVVVLSGGLPQGVPACCYKALIEEAKNFNIPVILDSGGDALKEGIKAKAKCYKTEFEGIGKSHSKRIKGYGRNC